VSIGRETEAHAAKVSSSMLTSRSVKAALKVPTHCGLRAGPQGPKGMDWRAQLGFPVPLVAIVRDGHLAKLLGYVSAETSEYFPGTSPCSAATVVLAVAAIAWLFARPVERLPHPT